MDPVVTGAWLTPDLSLPTQFEMEQDRRAAARMHPQQLAVKTDELIQNWYRQREMIDRLLGRVRQLEVEVALAGAPPLGGPKQEHYEWAAEVLRR
jgi:hypothetical protein